MGTSISWLGWIADYYRSDLSIKKLQWNFDSEAKNMSKMYCDSMYQ